MEQQQGCLHCPGGLGLKYPLFDDELFWIVCDAHPLVEGHILIITKEHISCMGALDENSFVRFKELYEKVSDFLNRTYGQTGYLNMVFPARQYSMLTRISSLSTNLLMK